MILGITGGTGAGKATLLRMMEGRGGYIMDCDAIYWQMLSGESALKSAIARRFPQAFSAQGQLQRKTLAREVFSNEEALADLNALVYHYLPREVERRIAEQPEGRLIGIDAVNLLECRLKELCHVTVAVVAPEELRLRRIMGRDGLTEEEALRRIRAQRDEEYYRQGCDYVLINDCAGVEEFEEKVEEFLHHLCQEE